MSDIQAATRSTEEINFQTPAANPSDPVLSIDVTDGASSPNHDSSIPTLISEDE